MFHSAIWSLDKVDDVSLDQLADNESLARQSDIPQAPMYYIALCAADEAKLPESSGKLWLFDDQQESVYQHYHGEIKRNMAAGAIIVGLEKKIEALQSETAPRPGSWWQRLFRKH